jgi:hypothetical protein
MIWGCQRVQFGSIKHYGFLSLQFRLRLVCFNIRVGQNKIDRPSSPTSSGSKRIRSRPLIEAPSNDVLRFGQSILYDIELIQLRLPLVHMPPRRSPIISSLAVPRLPLPCSDAPFGRNDEQFLPYVCAGGAKVWN